MFFCTSVLRKAKNCLSAFPAINDQACYISAERTNGGKDSEREREVGMDWESTPAFPGWSTQCSTLTAMHVSWFQQRHVCTVWPCFLAPRRGATASADSESNPLQASFSYLFYFFKFIAACLYFARWLVFGNAEKNMSSLIWFVVIEPSWHRRLMLRLTTQTLVYVVLPNLNWHILGAGQSPEDATWGSKNLSRGTFNLNYRSYNATWPLTLSLPLFYFNVSADEFMESWKYSSSHPPCPFPLEATQLLGLVPVCRPRALQQQLTHATTSCGWWDDKSEHLHKIFNIIFNIYLLCVNNSAFLTRFMCFMSWMCECGILLEHCPNSVVFSLYNSNYSNFFWTQMHFLQ